MSDGGGAFSIGARDVGPGEPALIVGEVSQTHDGSLGLAHAFVDAIADAGADAVKFQTHIADAESTAAEPFRVAFSPQDASRYEYWKRMEFTEEQWQGLEGHARDRGLIFLSSPFSEQAVELLERVGVPAWKVGSGDVANEALLQRIAVTGLPVVLSSGISRVDELDAAVDLLRKRDVSYAICQCTSRYPCPPEEVGLNVLDELRARYGCPVGLSDHSGTIYASLAAVTLGASLLEVHVTMSREMFGPDVPASVTTQEMRQLVDGARFIEAALASPVNKDRQAAELEGLRTIFGRSIVAGRDLPAGTLLERDMLVVKKPGSGLPPERLDAVLGKALARDVHADQLLREDDLE